MIRRTVGRLALPVALAVVACGGGRWIPAGDGVVRDRQSGLEWTSRDHDQSLTWEAADGWCRSSKLGGRDGWRLPEIDELRALYDKRLRVPCGDEVCRLDPAIRLGGPYVWSVTEPQPRTRFYFDFSAGNQLAPNLAPQLVRRVICVRMPA